MAKTPVHPSPPPYEVNDVAIVGGGTVLWFVAFLALLPFDGTLSSHGHPYWPWICLAGSGLGLIGLWYCRARQAAIRRSADPQPGPQSGPQSGSQSDAQSGQ